MEASLRRKSVHERMESGKRDRELKHQELIQKTRAIKQKLKTKPKFVELEENFKRQEEEA